MTSVADQTGVVASGESGDGPQQKGRSTLSLVVSAAFLVVSTALVLAPLVPAAIGGAAVLMMLGMMAFRFKLAVCLAVPSLLAIYQLRGLDAVTGSLTNVPLESLSSWTLSVLPMFVLVGVLLATSGLTTSIYAAAQKWLGWLPGGLAVGTNVAGAGFAAVSGSSMATTYTLARVGLPEMFRAGYGTRFSLAAVMSAGLPGQLIPPSILLIIYAGIVEVPIGQQLLAGVGPGLLVAVVFSAAFVVAAKVARRSTGAGANPGPSAGWGERIRALLAIWPLGLLIMIVIGGIYAGVVTATEAAAVAALASIGVLFLLTRDVRRSWRALISANVQAVSTIGTIFLLLIGVDLFSRMMSLTGLSSGFADLVEHYDLGRVQFLILMTVVYLVLGSFMETLPMILLTVPVLLPTLSGVGISPLWFGVFVVLMGEIAMLTPPVGILAMVVYQVARDPEVNGGRKVTLKDVFGAVNLLLPIAVVVVVLLIAFPDLVTMLADNAGE
jgi:C4-dicarboxylate transporter DctM subunit